MVTLRALADAELDRVNEIDDSDVGKVVLVQRGAETEPRPEIWHRPRTGPIRWDEHIRDWLAFPVEDRISIGAFDGESLVGIAVVRRHLDPVTAQLAALFVDRVHRRQGVAGALTRAAREVAVSSGASALYVSALPSEAAVMFYRSCGFVPTTAPNADLLALEPDDIHMIMSLEGTLAPLRG